MDDPVRSTLTVHDIDPDDATWLRAEARRLDVSVEAFVRRLIHERRRETGGREKPSAVFERHFGVAHGVEPPPRAEVGYRPLSLAEADEA